MAASATFALKAGVWFRRARLLIVSPDSRVNLARRQAETPLIPLFRFLRPALILTIRATAIGSAYYEVKVVVWVGAGTRLRIRKYEGGSDQTEYMLFEDAVREAYGAARNTDIGRSAEKMNTNGVLAWFAYYYHTHEIPVYGNVRNSTRVEPVLFRNIDIKMENDGLIGKEIYGDLIWEHMQVKKSDHARLLKILRDHARALKDG